MEHQTATSASIYSQALCFTELSIFLNLSRPSYPAQHLHERQFCTWSHPLFLSLNPNSFLRQSTQPVTHHKVNIAQGCVSVWKHKKKQKSSSTFKTKFVIFFISFCVVRLQDVCFLSPASHFSSSLPSKLLVVKNLLYWVFFLFPT